MMEQRKALTIQARCQRIFPLRMKASPQIRNTVQIPLRVALTAGRDESGIIVIDTQICVVTAPSFPQTWGRKQAARALRLASGQLAAQVGAAEAWRADAKVAEAEQPLEKWREPQQRPLVRLALPQGSARALSAPMARNLWRAGARRESIRPVAPSSGS